MGSKEKKVRHTFFLQSQIFSNAIFSLTLLVLVGCGNPATRTALIVGGNGGTLTVTAPSAPTSYNVNGQENPDLTLIRGQTYTFDISASGHPFYIMSVQGTNTADAYNIGVTNNGADSGSITFYVGAGTPDTLYYNCSAHAAMTGTITVN
jgi:hypothetical protein